MQIGMPGFDCGGGFATHPWANGFAGSRMRRIEKHFVL